MLSIIWLKNYRVFGENLIQSFLSLVNEFINDSEDFKNDIVFNFIKCNVSRDRSYKKKIPS